MKLSDIFLIEYGKFKTPINKLKTGKTPLISSGSKNNGIAGYFDITPCYKDVISVPRTGTICHAFYHGYDCVINSDCMVLIPKKSFDLKEKLYFVLCMRKEKYRYNYGRKVTPERLGNTLVSNLFPDWIYQTEAKGYINIHYSVHNGNLNLHHRNWKMFKYHEIFNFKKGQRIINTDMDTGETPCIRPIESNNGVYRLIDIAPNHKGNTITVSYNGSVGEAFYQPADYFALDDINVLYPKFELNQYIGMFLVAVIRKEKYRFNYGRKWHLERMKESVIKLPITEEEKPDWQFMEDYIKSLPYSKGLER